MRKIFLPIFMLLISATMLVSSTYAWFTMNTTVTATNMQVKAVAEKGILINEVAAYDSTSWDDQATTNQTNGIELRATSTADTKTWYVAYSKVATDAAAASAGSQSAHLANGGYKTLGTSPLTTSVESVAAVAGSNALREITYVDGNGNGAYDSGEGYYVKYTYYIKSSADAITCGLTAGAQNLNIAEVRATGNSGSADLDKALRVAVVVNGKAYIFAPITTTTTSYYVAAGNTATTVLTGPQATSLTTIPATTANGTPVYIYLYFEGEDANLKTQFVTNTLDDLTVEVDFELVTNDVAATDNGITVPTN